MKNENKELDKFIHDPKYRNRILNKIRSDSLNQFKREEKELSKKVVALRNERLKVSKRIEKSRWERIASSSLYVNMTEGKIQIGNSQYLFSSIKGATLDIQTGSRYVTKDNSKSKKHVSVGGAIIGGAVAGPVGAAIGGSSLGKTTTKGSSITEEIPTCTRMAVAVDIDGFCVQIPIISSSVDLSGYSYQSSYNRAESIISKLMELSHTPVPESFTPICEMPEILKISDELSKKEFELSDKRKEGPKFSIPNIYRTEESSSMTDQEYLEFLKKMDVKRENDTKEEEEARKAEAKRKREESIEHTKEYVSNIDFKKAAKNTTNIIFSIIFWLLSLFSAFMSFGCIILGSIVSFLFYLSGTIIINPLFHKFLRKRNSKMKIWVFVVLYFVVFIIGAMFFPSA